MHPGDVLRRALASGHLVRVGGVHDGLSAHVAARSGIDALWASGLGIAASHGVPDANILTMSEVRDATQAIVRASPLPVIADCDTGFGDVRNLRRTVHDFELAGVAAICIEDKCYPKRNSLHSPDQDLADAHEFAAKLRAAKAAQRHPALMVVARVEALIAGAGRHEALRRADLYASAGADAIVLHSKQKDPGEVLAFAAKWRERQAPPPLIAIPTTYSGIQDAELHRAGYSMVIYANQLLRAALGAMEQTMREIVMNGSGASVESVIPPVATVFELTGENEISAYETWYRSVIDELRGRSTPS